VPDIFDVLGAPEGPGGHDPVAAAQRARSVARGELPRRFYETAGVEPAGDGFRVVLDGRPVRTPARADLAFRDRAIAEAIAAEWAAQGERIDPATMPLTRLVNVAIDGVGPALEQVKDEIAAYAGSDLLSYRADGPGRLVARQTALWDPLVAHASRRLGWRIRLAEGVMPVEQDPGLVPAFRALLPDDPFALAGLHTVTSITGSALIALAVMDRVVTSGEAFAAAHVDEDWNIELWGEDSEAAARRAFRRAEMEAASLLLLAAVGGPEPGGFL
jgi:chaperone required for assembly of F1-ATPase